MGDISKQLTQEQKEFVLDYVVNHFKNGGKLKPTVFNNMFDLINDDNDITYCLSMSIFNLNELFCIIVTNSKLNISFTINISDIKSDNDIKFIESNVISFQNNVNVNNGKLSDDDFYKITNLDVDVPTLRAKKIKKIQDNM